MITTVTLNPAVDKTYTAKTILPGQVNRTTSMMMMPGGKGINVARVLNQYGFRVRAMGFFGGYAGYFIRDSVQKQGVQCEFTMIQGETRSNMNIMMEDHPVTEILEPGPTVTPDNMERFLNQYQTALQDSSLVVLSGSIPAGVPSDIYATLIRLAKKQNIRVLLDTSGESLLYGLQEKPFLCKPNQNEMAYIAGKELNTIEDILPEARKLQQTGIPLVLVSMGEKGLLAVEEDRYHIAKVEGIHAVNTVACGDSVIASFAMSLELSENMEQAMRRAVAISAANATTMESGQIPKEVAKDLMTRVEYECGI